MPEYLTLKGDTPSLKFFKSPDLASRATIDAQRILNVDAAIVFTDLLPMLEPMGLELDYVQGVGPVFNNTVRSIRDIQRLKTVPAQEGLGFIAETIALALDGLPREIPLIGFAGAPFTLASYIIEGRSSKNFTATKCLMHNLPDGWSLLMDKLADGIIDYVNLQIDSGVHAVQIFDSWVGCLSEREYQRCVAPATQKMMSGIGRRVPIVYFGTGNVHLLDAMYATGPSFMALDWRAPLKPTWDRLGCPAIQGNLDPALLCADIEVAITEAKVLLNEINGTPGHIFNLGHGILLETPVDNVKRLVDFVHEYSQELR